MFAVTGLVKYGVAHYDPPSERAKPTIAAPTRPGVKFHNTDPTDAHVLEPDVHEAGDGDS